MKQNTAVSNYNALQISFRHTSHGLTLQTAYTWSHAIDDSTSTYFTTVDDSNFGRWKATSDLNRTHVLQMNFIYALPFFKNSSSAVARQALGGWQVSGIGSFFTGQPVNFGCGISGFSTGIGGGVQCNTVGKVQINKSTYNDPTYGPTLSWWNPNTVAQPLFSQLAANNQAGMFGSMGRNVLTGPGRNNFDIALEKNFSTPWFKGEHSTVQFRLETFNTFNHTQYNGVSTGCSDTTPFGGTCGPTATDNIGNGTVSSAWSPRNIQLGLKFIF
jgi:hypothetical protein